MINIVVEGESDRETAKAVVRAAGRNPSRVVVTGGTGRMDARIASYNRAAAQYPWVVFRDSDASCPVQLRARLTASISQWDSKFALRIAHSMSEAWLLADRERFAEYFSVPINRITSDPEALPHAKRTLLTLCAGSRSSAVRKEVTVNGGQVGPLYVLRLNEFASTVWRPDSAADSSDSLRRAIERIQELPLS